jgi:hypothetical protein
MTKKANCKACTNIRFGVKTRIAVPHSCGKTDEEIRKFKQEIDADPPFPRKNIFEK